MLFWKNVTDLHTPSVLRIALGADDRPTPLVNGRAFAPFAGAVLPKPKHRSLPLRCIDCGGFRGEPKVPRWIKPGTGNDEFPPAPLVENEVERVARTSALRFRPIVLIL